MSLTDHLDDLTVRFLLNLPASELSSVPRLCFQVEEAQWFYEDFIRPAAAAAGEPLPSLTLRQFCLALFQHCPLLKGFSDEMHIAAYEEFLAYKVRVPVRGAILMSEDMERLVLVKGWKKGASWSFPRGKINKNERDLDCAIREVYEETGYDVRQAGLVPRDENEVKAIDITMREQHIKLFVFRGVKEDTYFEPRTRKEISKIQWYNVRDLPGFKKQKSGEAQYASKFYMVAPFLGYLKKWIKEQRQNDARLSRPGIAAAEIFTDGEATENVTGDAMEDVTNKSEELKKLLMIPARAEQQTRPEVAQSPSPRTQPLLMQAHQTNDLLALLRGNTQASPAPLTTFEKIGVESPPQSRPPQPHYQTQPQPGYHGPLPQSQYPVNRSQQHEMDLKSGVFNRGPAGLSPNPAWAALQQSLYGVPPPNMSGIMPESRHGMNQQQDGHNRETSFHPSERPPAQSSQMPQQAPMPRAQFSGQDLRPQYQRLGSMDHRLQQIPSQPFNQQQPGQLWAQGQGAAETMGPQGGHGAIAAGPSVPNAENLPVPNLNAHSMKLLGAFNGHAKSPGQFSSDVIEQATSQTSSQQNALLSLLKQKQEPVKLTVFEQGLAGSGGQQLDPESLQRRKTLNEITRTLPAVKIRSPSPVYPVADTASIAADRLEPATTVHAQPANVPLVATSGPGSRLALSPEPQQVSKTILQRPGSSTSSRIVYTPQSSSPALGSHQPSTLPAPQKTFKKHATRAGTQATPQAKPFTILARPTSRSGSNSGLEMTRETHTRESSAQNTTLPTRQETIPEALESRLSAYPQVLQKEGRLGSNVDQGVDLHGKSEHDKRDQLLALFGRKDASSQPPPSAPRPILASKPVSTSVSPRPSSTLNETEATGISMAHPRVRPGPSPSSLPYLPAIEKVTPVSSGTKAATQETLLNLFTRTSSSPPVPSPTASSLDRKSTYINTLQNPPGPGLGSPISPFVLGTPARHFASQAKEVSSPISAGGRSTGTPTPTEAKGFLLNYLNGVVQKEGARNGARG